MWLFDTHMAYPQWILCCYTERVSITSPGDARAV
jgi:hypothetical protein